MRTLAALVVSIALLCAGAWLWQVQESEAPLATDFPAPPAEGEPVELRAPMLKEAQASGQEERMPISPSQPIDPGGTVSRNQPQTAAPFFVELVQRGSQIPLAETELLLEVYSGRHWSRNVAPERLHATTGSEGDFALEVPGTTEGACQLTAPGFGPVVFDFRAAATTRDAPLVVALDRSAGLSADILNAGVLDPSISEVLLGVESYFVRRPEGSSFHTTSPDLSFAVGPSSDGRFHIKGLPPNVPLKAVAKRGPMVVFRAPDPIVLPVGETREVTWVIGGDKTLSGLVVETDGTPVSDLELWVCTEAGGLFLRDGDEIERKTRTDRQGRFQIEQMPVGTWRVGPGALPDWPRPEKSAGAIAPASVEVEIGADDTRREITLTVHRGLYIKGRVVDPRGDPLSDCNVFAHGKEIRGWTYTWGQEDGTFLIGPLVPAEYSIKASSTRPRPLASSEPQLVAAGSEGIELRLRAGGTISGKAVDAATGKAQRARISVSAVEDNAGTTTTWSHDTGTFQFSGRQPGEHLLTAATDDGLYGMLTMQVDAGVDHAGVEVPMTRGGRLRVRYTGTAPSATLRVLVDGRTVSFKGIQNGAQIVMTVPAATLRLELGVFAPASDDRMDVVRVATVAPGTEEEVRFELE